MIFTALQVVAAFNLICTGTHFMRPISDGLRAFPAGEPFTRVYRIDLRDGRYCVDRCETTERLVDVSTSEIVFQSAEQSQTNTEVSRETGRYSSTTLIGNSILMYSGQCERAPFTGFPQQRF